MTQEYYFHNAKWVGAENRTRESFSVIRGYFETQTNDKVTFVHILFSDSQDEL